MLKHLRPLFLAALLALAACDSPKHTELRLWDSPLEDFSFKDVTTLTFHGAKDKDLVLEVASLFMSTSPACRGMYVLDEKSDQGFLEHSYRPPGADVAGKYYKVQFLFERADSYSVETPLQLRHSQCDWGLSETKIQFGNDFNMGRRKRTPREGKKLTLISLSYVSREEFEKNKISLKSTRPIWEYFPQEIKMHLFNLKDSYGKKYLPRYFEGQDNKNNVPFMPRDIMDKSVSIKMDLHVEAVADESKGERLPDIPPLKKWHSK